MPSIHYYGRKTDLVGKTLFEILANIRNFGVGRMLIKQEELLKNPGQKCYYIVKKVEPVMDDKLQEGAIYAERVFRNAKVPELVFVDEESWHTDWQLIPRHEEHKYQMRPEELVEHGHPSTVTVLPRWMESPPLMDVFLRRHFKARKGTDSAQVNLDTPLINIRMHYEMSRMSRPERRFRVAEEGEEADVDINKPIQKLLSRRFYSG